MSASFSLTSPVSIAIIFSSYTGYRHDDCYNELMVDTKTKRRIATYYTQAEIDYKLLWRLRTQQAMHFGFWTEHAHNLSQALKNQDKIMAELAGITKDDLVLDAGCGIGGSSLFLAKAIGCKVVGISIVEQQVKKARHLASRFGLSAEATFSVADFTAMPFAENTFDVVWAIESVCYAPKKEQFLREAFRVLKPGGTLIVADGFALKEEYSHDEATIMAYWLSGWEVQALDTTAAFCSSAKSAGFYSVHAQDYTTAVLPSSRLLHRFSYVYAPFDWILHKTGIRNQVHYANLLAARYQYVALANKLWQYAVITATKPK